MEESLKNVKIQRLSEKFSDDIPVDVLRLDLIDPVISGNKWFKLRDYLAEAMAGNYTMLASFGGAYSNHIVATAAAAAGNDLRSMGLIRGDAGVALSPTLLQARAYGMELVFVNREEYRNKVVLMQTHHRPGAYWIMEGGYGVTGAKGAAGIAQFWETNDYTHIFCSAGTGTTLAGLINAAGDSALVNGVTALKGYENLAQDIQPLLTDHAAKYRIHHDYHFGGYAKYTNELIDFMNELWATEQLPTDIVYTGKLLYAVKDLVKKKSFTRSDRLLVIHSGGLQGNRSLAPRVLHF